MDWITVPITPANETAVQFNIIGGTNGNTYNFSITSTGGGSPVTGSGTIDANPDPITANVSSLGNGGITVEVTLTNIIGTGAPVTDTVQKGSAPTGYSVVWTTDPINAGNEANAEFDIIGGTAGNTYNFTVTSSAGGTPLTGNGTIITDPTPRILDVSSLPDGTLTVQVELTNAFGTGAPVTDTVNKSTITTPITIAVGAPTPGIVAEQATDIVFTITYTDADTITLAPGDITLTSTAGTPTATIAVTGAGTSTRTVTLSNVQGVGNVGLSIASGTATNGTGASAPAGATVPGEECRIVAGFVVPSAVQPELLAYVSAIEQTGGQGSAVTTITDGAGNLTGITTDGITVNIRTNGNPEFDFTGTSSHINLGTPSVLNFVPFVDDWTALIIVGTAKGPSSTTFYAQGDRATGLGYQSLFYAGIDNLYPFLFRNNPPSGWANLTTGIGDDAIAQTAEGAVTSTEFRAYQDGTELGASPKFIIATAANWADPWIIGAEEDSSDGSGFIPGSVYDGQLQAVMFFGKVLTPAEMIAIRDEILNQ